MRAQTISTVLLAAVVAFGFVLAAAAPVQAGGKGGNGGYGASYTCPVTGHRCAGGHCGGRPSGPKVHIGVPHISIPHVGGGGCKGGHCGGCKGGHCGGGKTVNKKVVTNNFTFNRTVNSNNTYIRGGSSYTTVINKVVGGGFDLDVAEACIWQETTLLKAVRAVCVDPRGGEHPAARVAPDTFVDYGFAGEIYRCFEGTRLKAVIGDMAGTDVTAASYVGGEELHCGPRETLHHARGGRIVCAPAVPRRECFERTSLRRYGAGDLIFTARAEVCVPPARTAARGGEEVSLSGFGLEGGVGYGHW